MTLQEAIKSAAKFKRKGDAIYIHNDGGKLLQDAYYPFLWIPRLADIIAEDYEIMECTKYPEDL